MVIEAHRLAAERRPELAQAEAPARPSAVDERERRGDDALAGERRPTSPAADRSPRCAPTRGLAGGEHDGGNPAGLRGRLVIACNLTP